MMIKVILADGTTMNVPAMVNASSSFYSKDVPSKDHIEPQPIQGWKFRQALSGQWYGERDNQAEPIAPMWFMPQKDIR